VLDRHSGTGILTLYKGLENLALYYSGPEGLKICVFFFFGFEDLTLCYGWDILAFYYGKEGLLLEMMLEVLEMY